MRRPSRRRPVPLLVAAVTIPMLGTLVPQAGAQEDRSPEPAAQEETEQIRNGDFTEGTAPWWWTPTAPAAVVDGALCAEIEGDTINPWDAIVGHDGIRLQAGESYDLSFTASASAPVIVNTNVQLSIEPYTQELNERTTLSAEPVEFSYAFTSGADTETAQVAFQVGGAVDPWTFCLDDVSLRGGDPPPPYEPDTGPRVRVNQVGYLPSGPKQATVVTDAAEALPWELTDPTGTVVAEGLTVPQGIDPSSEQATHGIDFTEVTTEATGLTLSADGETSHPFDIDAGLYDTLRTDALAFFYHQRSGIEIEAEYVGADYARPAGHVGVAPNLGDIEVPCQPGVCDYTLDVSGGWYDAGDHGKYVVNGGISAAQVMGVYERALVAGDTDAVADGTLSIPEQANGVPDVLDEARWQLEFLLSMQVPEGEEHAGLVHHKIHDAAWTGLPLLPHRDPQLRELHPVSTAATLNLAAAGAQCARLFGDFDQDFADRCLTAAETAWTAAETNPIHYADPLDGIGGGAYSDDDVTDEFYWAAAELFLTTGEQTYLDVVTGSEHHGAQAFTDWGFGWAVVGPLGLLNLATVPSDLPADQLDFVRDAVVDGASRYAATAADEVYGLPYAPADHAYVWGSNSQVLNNMVVLGVAYDLTGDAEFRDAVLTGWDYLLGGNPLNISYVTGYGEHDARNQHHRFWANQLDPALPNPPPGSVAGGPNVSLDDPVAAEALAGCAPAFCYIDDIESWSTNEVTINWNAPLAWVAAFTADVAGDDGPPTEPPAGTCSVSYLVQSQWNNGFTAEVSITNLGDEPVRGWALDWTFDGDQLVTHSWNTRLVQRGATVSASDVDWNSTIGPGRSVTFGFNGSFSGTNGSPAAFTLNGDACG